MSPSEVSLAAPDEHMFPLRILLVDDHTDTRVIMERMLVRRGYQVTPAGTFAEALENFRNGDFDLVISDLSLPDGSGHGLLEEMLVIKPVEAIALSGYGMASDLERSVEAGFSRHLIKPVDLLLLEAAISEIVARRNR